MKNNFIALVFCGLSLVSCAKKSNEIVLLDDSKTVEKIHSWYYFNENGFEQVKLPQNAPGIPEKPWTEAMRISSASRGYLLVNRLGVLGVENSVPVLYQDKSIFENESADGLVFDGEIPIFYLFRSTFFNEHLDSEKIQDSRTVLVEFNPDSKICFPLVSYKNLEMDENEQICGFSWNGLKWVCASKKQTDEGIEFKYFFWQTPVSLTDLNPALGSNTFEFEMISETKYKDVNAPVLFDQAPESLKTLLKSIPDTVSFYIKWYDGSGRSPVSYYNGGNEQNSLNAFGENNRNGKYLTAVFEDGTTYINDKAFRLPKLPRGFTYSSFTIKDDLLVVAWEEKKFYNTSRAGFITVELNKICN